MLDIQYLGAAHGLTGILQILLSVPGYFQVYISKYFHVLLVLLKVYGAIVKFSEILYLIPVSYTHLTLPTKRIV